MWFTEPEEIKEILVEAPLELDTPEEAERNTARGQTQQPLAEIVYTMPIVSIGYPETWPLSEVYPLRKMPRTLRAKLIQADFYLVRLACSFWPVHKESHIQWARFRVTLLPDSSG